jgi:large subunit ribosomal protein L30
VGKLRIQWRKSAIGYSQDQRKTLRALGLRRLYQVVEQESTPTTWGMVRKVQHLASVEELTE